MKKLVISCRFILQSGKLPRISFKSLKSVKKFYCVFQVALLSVVYKNWHLPSFYVEKN